ncbi:cache domain-containing protein [Desulfosoma caldarium]|uniref:cache domain-containing protein n=1 Tax=Desulfosoma caldarium TaxID=610254 RepID=UPI0011CE9359|nr:cache domain-containing protein [Desulfosoma caldarium]
MDLSFEERISQLYTVAHTHSFEQIRSQEKLYEIFGLLQHRSKYFVALGVINDQGNHVAYAGPYALKGINYKDSEWFQSVRLRGIYMSDVFLGVRNFPHFVIAVMRREEKKFWILRATMNTDLFESMVKVAQAGEFGDAFLVNQRNVLQTSSRFLSRVMENLGMLALPWFAGTRLITQDIGQRTMVVGATWLQTAHGCWWSWKILRKSIFPFLQTRSLALILLAAGVAVVVLGAVFIVTLPLNVPGASPVG